MHVFFLHAAVSGFLCFQPDSLLWNLQGTPPCILQKAIYYCRCIWITSKNLMLYVKESKKSKYEMPFGVQAFWRTALSLQHGEELLGVKAGISLALSSRSLILWSWVLPPGAASWGREREAAAAAQPLTCQGQGPLAAVLTAASLLDFIVTANLISSHLVLHVIDWELKRISEERKAKVLYSNPSYLPFPPWTALLPGTSQCCLCLTCKNSHHISNKGVSVKCIA